MLFVDEAAKRLFSEVLCLHREKVNLKVRGKKMEGELTSEEL
jgi:hypothetical protein